MRKVAAPAEIKSSQRQSGKQQDSVKEAFHHLRIPMPDLSTFEQYYKPTDRLIEKASKVIKGGGLRQ
jgi:hypothetical protein